MSAVSCEQIVRDILAEMPNQIRERLWDGEDPQTFAAEDLTEMAEVLRDHIGFLRASLTRTKETLAEQERQNRVLRAECQFLKGATL